MKTVKKLTALLIVLTLLFALSITAFADFDPQTQYRIKFFVNGTEMNAWEIQANAGNSVYCAIDSSSLNTTFIDVEDYYTPGVYHKALQSLQGFSATPGAITDVPYSYIIQYPTISAVANHPGYFLLEHNIEGYHYLYVGIDWFYRYEGGSNLNIYMDQCFPAANNVMEVSYEFQVTEWTQDTPIT